VTQSDDGSLSIEKRSSGRLLGKYTVLRLAKI